MAIISSSLDESNIPCSRQELRLVDSKIIGKEKIDRNLNLARPTSFKEFIGQEHIKSLLKIAIDASKYRKESLEHILLYGQPGLGKTTLALLISSEMNAKCKVASAPSIERPRDIVGLLLAGAMGGLYYMSAEEELDWEALLGDDDDDDEE